MSSETFKTSLLEGDGEPGRLEIDDAELRVVAGPDRGLKVRLGADSLFIGSAADCDIVLHDGTVSARHAELSVSRSGYVIRDLGSTNGIFVGAQPIERAPLVDGTKLRLGGTTIAIRSLGTRTTIPLGRSGSFNGLVAHSVKMRAVVATLENAARSDATILLEGETGSGKEVAAHAVHAESSRHNGPFVIFDCGGVSANLIASELFGHEVGAFSGATTTRVGHFEEADGGTLFLDEIGELPLDLQASLLGAIDRKMSRRVGGSADIRHDVRIVAATNRNLAEEVRARRFREDLFFRLSVIRVRLPPLRERPEDLPILADRFARELGVTLSPEVRALLSSHAWPGNVRELRNTVARVAAHPDVAPSGLLEARPTAADDLCDETGALIALPEARRMNTERFERRYVEAAFARAEGDSARAAELAGVSRQFLTGLAVKHGLRSRRR